MSAAQINQRLAAYIAAAMLTTFLGEGDNLRAAAGWVDYAMIAGRVLLAGVLIWRAFVDTSKTQEAK